MARGVKPLMSSRLGGEEGGEEGGIFFQYILIATNSFEFRRSIQRSQAGFDPPFAEGAEFTE